jgi:hypothetical protein
MIEFYLGLKYIQKNICEKKFGLSPKERFYRLVSVLFHRQKYDRKKKATFYYLAFYNHFCFQ